MPIRFKKDEHIAFITIDRPHVLNAVDLELTHEMADTLIGFRAEPGLWVAIITGAGDRSFSTGADLHALGESHRSLTPLQRCHLAETEPGLDGTARNLEVWKPIIAAINGYCLGVDWNWPWHATSTLPPRMLRLG
jgi:enoyl-CoA hydratase/carnithine racemase